MSVAMTGSGRNIERIIGKKKNPYWGCVINLINLKTPKHKNQP